MARHLHRSLPAISDAEWLIMSEFWRLGEATVKTIKGALEDKRVLAAGDHGADPDQPAGAEGRRWAAAKKGGSLFTRRWWSRASARTRPAARSWTGYSAASSRLSAHLH